MVVLSRKLEASSLPECIVASVILLVCFLIVMETLTRVMLAERNPIVDVSVECALRWGHREYGNGKYFPGKYTREYDWGTLEIELKDYSVNLRQLTLTALPGKGTRTVRYDYLIEMQR